MDEPTWQQIITQKAKELVLPLLHQDIVQRYKKLGPAPTFWHADNEPREFKEELINVGKYKYLGEWDPTSNTPHGFGFWIKTNGKTLIECYCK